MAQRKARKSDKVVGVIIFVVILAAGLLLGTQSALVLERHASGRVDATNAWRLHNTVTLVSRSVSGLREVRMADVSLTTAEQRSGAYRDALGMFTQPEELLLVGDGTVAYPYREDLSLIQAFLRNTHSTRSVITHPVDIRRQVSSWVLLAVAATTVVGWLIKRVLGRDPLADAPDKVKPLPPAVGTAVFGGVVLLGIAFFTYGDQFFGPLATRKVDLLMASARTDDAPGIARAVASGVFIDARDNQGITALMVAATHGATRATQALLSAHASPDLRSISHTSALDMAVRGAHEALALQLMDAHADIHAGGMHNRTPVHLAASAGACQALEGLIARGATVTQQDEQGWTPLMAAASSGKLACVRALLAAGADPSVALADGRRAVDVSTAMAAARPPGHAAEDMDIQRLLKSAHNK